MEDTRRVEQRVFAFIEKYRLLVPGDGVVAGVSGGADSVCLLFVLDEWRKRWGLRLQAVHVNHGIRPEAGEDAAYVGELCGKLGIPLTLVERDVRAEAAENGRSEEEMGRLIRYEAFEKAARETGASKIAVAHNANDQAETMLFHLFRGTGLSGLGGMRPRRDKIIRPLLCLERKEIEAYLAQKGVPYCRDVTNASDEYTRNRIRHHILPYAEEQVAGRCVAHMGQTAELLQELEEYLEGQVEEARRKAVREEAWGATEQSEEGARGRAVQEVREAAAEPEEEAWNGQPGSGPSASVYRLNRSAFLALPQVLGKRLLLQLLKELSSSGKDIGHVHVEEVCALAAKAGNGSLDLPCGICALSQYGEVILYRHGTRNGAETAGKAQNVLPESVPPCGPSPVKALDSSAPRWKGVAVTPSLLGEKELGVPVPGGKTLYFSVFPYEKNKNIPKNEYTKWFDCDKMKRPLLVRLRETGDFFSIRQKDGGLAHQSLKQYMINEKIPRQERNRKVLVAEGSHILWAVGHRISEYYKVEESTRRILQIRLE